MSDDTSEAALRAHIRELLLDYAHTHLTIDHVQYSQAVVSEILARILKPIPTHEPGQLALPGDPFQALKARWKLDELAPYDEIWRPTPEAMEFIRANVNLPKGKPRTQTVWDEDEEFDYACLAHRPMTPLLSRSSRNKTPLLGKPMKQTSIRDHLSSHAVMLFIDNENIPETNHLKLDECMDVRLTIDASTHSSLIDLQQKNPFLSCSVPRSLSNHASDFLRCRSPEYKESYRLMSPPVFPREKDLRRVKAQDDNSILRHVRFAPLEVEEIDPDIPNANMAIVNGWTTFASSASTPPLSSGTSDLDELDEDSEFWRPSSSPNEPMIIERLEAVKMDEPIFPRAERPRCGKANKFDEQSKQSLLKFITTYIPTDSTMRILTKPSSDGATQRQSGSPLPDASTAPLSVLGQPPSESDASSTQLSDAPGDALDKDIWRILKFRGGKGDMRSYQDAIMHERLDEKQAMFMDVPTLPAPNEYLRNVPGNLGNNMGSKSSRPGIGPERCGLTLPATFKKVTGLKSLNLELSWRPFTFGSKVPTNLELLGVDSIFSAGQDEILMLTAVESFLADSVFPTGLDNPSDSQRAFDQDSRFLRDIFSDIDFSNIDARFNPDRDFDDDVQFLFCRSDRRPLPSFQHRNFHDAPANLTADSPSNKTPEFSSAITPELNSHFQATQNAADNDFYADMLTFTVASRDNALGDDYCNYQYREHPDIGRDRKRCRINDPELDALCAMDTMSQSTLLTVDPKDLVLPPSNTEFYAPNPDEYSTTDPAIGSVDSIFMTFNPSQSLSLSLDEDDVPVEISTYNTQQSFIHSQPISLPLNGDSALQALDPALISSFAFRDPENGTGGQDEMYIVTKYPDGNDSVGFPFPQTIHSLGSVSTRNHPSRADHAGTPQDQELAPRLELKNSEPNRHVTGAIDLHHLQEVAVVEPRAEDAGLHVEKQEQSRALFPYDALSGFLQLRGRKNAGKACHPQEHEKQTLEDNTPRQPEEAPHPQVSSPRVSWSAPQDLLTVTKAFIIPDPWQNPATEHAYLVSVDVLQQRALIGALESPRCTASLVGRDLLSPLRKRTSANQTPRMHSVDISVIVGPDAGVVFFPLCALPSQNANRALLDALATHSWRFSNILLVLMAFPRSRLIRATNLDAGVHDGLNVYSPPVLKAARLLRRELGLREGTGEKRASCVVELAFADDVEQAAILVRAFGDMALRDSVVDFTQYIGEEELEGEQDLAELEGMNTFCAAVILRCVTLEEFLDMSPERRAEGLSELVGRERIEHVNAVLESRKQVMDMDEELSPSIETLESQRE